MNPRKKKKKPPSARRRARRQQRFLEKKAAEKATSPKRSVSQATIPKEPESVPKKLDLSSEIRKEPINLVESETSSETSNSAHLNNQTSGASLPASMQEEQEILKDFIAANIYSDDDFGDTGVCANCNREPKDGTVFKKGDKSLASNYRPISLTCILCKVLEHILASNIVKHID